MLTVGLSKGDSVYTFSEIDDVPPACIGLLGCDVLALVDKALACSLSAYFLSNFSMSFVNDKIVVHLFYRAYKWFRTQKILRKCFS